MNLWNSETPWIYEEYLFMNIGDNMRNPGPQTLLAKLCKYIMLEVSDKQIDGKIDR